MWICSLCSLVSTKDLWEISPLTQYFSLFRYSSSNLPQCGGVLLNHWYIATAAHCVHRAKLNKISVILGEYDTKDGEEEPLESETFKVDHIIIHPDFR